MSGRSASWLAARPVRPETEKGHEADFRSEVILPVLTEILGYDSPRAVSNFPNG